MSKKESSSTNENLDFIYNDFLQEIDMSEAPFKRILSYLSKVENPQSFQMEGYQIELEWENTNITLQDRMNEIFAIN